jgi:putative redox protein
MKHTIGTKWMGNMKFDAQVSGHQLTIDALPAVGGENAGPRPKELMLVALAGCTGMDVISILKKMRVDVEDFHVDVEAEVTEDHPKHYTSMHIIYSFKGANLEKDKLEKAIELSQEKYCGVSVVYRKAMPVTHEIRIIE